MGMVQVVERCAGLDVHRSSVVACARLVATDGTVTIERARFGATTGELLALRDWLVGQGVSEVAMEATGVYWKPVYSLLEGAVERLLVVNARHVKQVPGRKTDQTDAEWLAQLLAHGLVRGGFVPPQPIRDLRELTRRRKILDPGTPARGQSAAQDARGRRHQAGFARLRRAGRLGAGDAGGARRRSARSLDPRRARQGQDALQADRAGPGPSSSVLRTSPGE